MYEIIKRVLDLALTVTGLIVIAPMLLLIALLIKLESPGPAMYAQERIGKGGQKFRLYKFRTMYVDELSKGKQGFTKMGIFLRQASMNELPSLFNVLQGDISLVGPRPAIPYEVERYVEWQKARLGCKPGLTGYWQVYGKKNTIDEMMKMDLEYMNKRSLWLDMLIIFRTPLAVFSKPS